MYQLKIKGKSPVPLGKIIALGRNYLDHIRELNNSITQEPVLFFKPASSIIENGQSISIPKYSQNCQHELELAVLIGRQGQNIPPTQSHNYIAGYAVALDMTLRDVQEELKKKGLPWEIAKGFDGSCPLSEFVPAELVKTPNHLDMSLFVNGQLRQSGNTAQMMRPIEEIIAVVSRYFTLSPGDVILTGTPSGVAAVSSGDQLIAKIEQIGKLEVSIT